MEIKKLIQINSQIGALLHTLEISEIEEVKVLLEQKTAEFCQVLVGEETLASIAEEKGVVAPQASESPEGNPVEETPAAEEDELEIAEPAPEQIVEQQNDKEEDAPNEICIPEQAVEQEEVKEEEDVISIEDLPAVSALPSEPSVPSAVNITEIESETNDVPLAPVVNVSVVEESQYDDPIFTTTSHRRNHNHSKAPQQPQLFTPVNEQMPNQVRLEDMLATKENPDFSKSFSINDKYRYIREIFNNNVNDFNSAITKVSSMTSLHEAYDYFLNELGWEADDETVAEFLQKVANHFNAVQ